MAVTVGCIERQDRPFLCALFKKGVSIEERVVKGLYL